MIAAMARKDHDPIAKFIRWLEDARRARIPNYEAIALATAARSGKPSVRFVLLKGIDERGFVFFTDERSRKGRELSGNAHASLAFYWQPRGRQVRIEGRVKRVTPEDADAYWSTRPAAEPACGKRVRTECLAALACGTSGAMRAARYEVQGTRSPAPAALDWISGPSGCDRVLDSPRTPSAPS
jgi:hypothetical protein